MPVSAVFENLAAGASVEEIIEQFDITREQINEVLAFAARSLEGTTERWRRGFEHESGAGAPKDLAEAIYWYGLAGGEGQSAALQALGNMAVRGQGFAKADPAAAETLWRAAAARGEAAAMHNLGVIFERGIGTTANREKAIRWYRLAATLRYADATAALKRLGQ